jgi:hypothetical protein
MKKDVYLIIKLKRNNFLSKKLECWYYTILNQFNKDCLMIPVD